MHIRNCGRLLCLAACLAVGTEAGAAIAPTPTYATAVVDSNPVEWNVAGDNASNDYYAPMYTAGDPAKPVLANGYLRYDCSTGTLYVLVLQTGIGTVGAIPLLASPTGNAWTFLDGNKNVKEYTDGT